MGNIPSCYCCPFSKQKSVGDESSNPNEHSEIFVPNQNTEFESTQVRPFPKRVNRLYSSNMVINFKGLKHCQYNNIANKKESENEVHNRMVKRNKSSIDIAPTVDKNNYIIINGKKTFIQRSSTNYIKSKVPNEYKKALQEKLVQISTKAPKPFKAKISEQRLVDEDERRSMNSNRLRVQAPMMYDSEIMSVCSSAALSVTSISKHAVVKKPKTKKRKNFEVINQPFDEKKLIFIK